MGLADGSGLRGLNGPSVGLADGSGLRGLNGPPEGLTDGAGVAEGGDVGVAAAERRKNGVVVGAPERP